ncbi:hypothetical protein IL306_014587 [Fusarium sp. DS 682]|nr:hypothetical protein IL306_014587 [Fusarium sp. DS 682]
MHDELACHLEIHRIGSHYGVPKLCELTRDNIQKVFGARQWNVSAFIFTVELALKSKDDKLHKLLFSISRGHLYSLANSDGFDPVAVLRSFHPRLREQDDVPQQNEDQADLEKARTALQESSTELERLRSQVTSLQQQVATVSTDRDQLQDHVSTTLTENEELRQSLASITAEQAQTRDEVSAASPEKEELAQRTTALSAERDDLQQRLDDERDKAAQSELKHLETVKTLAVFQKDLRVVTFEKKLLKSRWEDVKEKLSTLTREHDALKKTLADEKKSKESVSTSARDEFRNALKDEQKESSKLSAQLIQTAKDLEMAKIDAADAISEKQRWQDAYTKDRKKLDEAVQERDSLKKDLKTEKRKQQVGMSLAERDHIQQALGAEKQKVKALTKERDDAKRQVLENFDKNKVTTFISVVEKTEECLNRRCKADYGAYIENDGGELVMKCRYCHFYYPHTT